ncbi:sugar phosphate isomerase/epimerase family protein [Schlesneria paludicola]|uniref:sugar phosphate isomerase/epimerase family protein n=1 Tax=Schlesneria paludicola TaxID=360056 RepID=UPI00029ACC43|nr:sugar phosphate isomerase/epimerase [Schlesneria paludicola]
MESPISRRTFCHAIAAGASCVSLRRTTCAEDQPAGIRLSIGNYGMPHFTAEQAIRVIGDLGYDGIELSVMPTHPTSAEAITKDQRGPLHQLLAEKRLTLTSLMEHLPPSSVAAEHQTTLDRLKRAAELGRDLSPEAPPLIQTVIGGGTWEQKKDLFRDRLGDWLRVAEAEKTVIAIKPHRSGAMSKPSEAAWLLGQLGNSRWLGMAYDFSHYALRDLNVSETINDAFPSTALIVVKDVLQKEGQIEFGLPGEGHLIDHADILTSFYRRGYRGSVCCEVSVQVSRRTNYDAEAAAKSSYVFMNQLLERAGIPRRPR